MKILNCPLNGPRNISEFICFGEVTNMPNPNDMSDEQWADFIWMSNNTAGVVQEWWCHAATSYWFIAERKVNVRTLASECASVSWPRWEYIWL